MADISFPADRIFSQTVSGRPKSEVLHALQERHPGARSHFVEDKPGTLHKVCEGRLPPGKARSAPIHTHFRVRCVLRPKFTSAAVQVSAVEELKDWQLYLVDWGYNTAKERKHAATDPRIAVVDIHQFCALAHTP